MYVPYLCLCVRMYPMYMFVRSVHMCVCVYVCLYAYVRVYDSAIKELQIKNTFTTS
jgi:hypothetical protein